MTRFDAGEPEGAVELDYEQALEALLTMIGRQVLVLFSGSDGSPFIAGIVSGRLDRGELDERLQEVLLRADDASVETLFFHVGSRQSGFVIRAGRVRARLLARRYPARPARGAVRDHRARRRRARQGARAVRRDPADARSAALDAYLEGRASQGFRIETRSSVQAVIIRRHRPYFLLRWLARGRSEQRLVVSVDQHGEVNTLAAEPIRW